MRIIGGIHRGRKLITPTNQDIRPTSDRMRETLFNILSHAARPLQGADVLDVFAGTGAMGLEALSRGAAHATFFDKDKAALALIKKNIALLGCIDNTIIKCINAPEFPLSKRQYDFIFLDPPYNLNLIQPTIESLDKNNYLADGCVIIAEYKSDNPLKFSNNFDILKEKTYGQARFTYLVKTS